MIRYKIYSGLDRIVSIEHIFIIIVLQHYHYKNNRNINSYTSYTT